MQEGLTSGPLGEVLLTLVWPPGVPPGAALRFQYAIQDEGAPVNVANAVQATAQ